MNATKKTILPCLLLAALTHATCATASVASGLPASSYSASASFAGFGAYDAFNGGTWNAGTFGAHWLQVDLGVAAPLTGVSFLTVQSPDGFTGHSLFVSDAPIGSGWSGLAPVASTSGVTGNGTPISFSFAAVSARYVQLVADGGPSWTALSNVSVVAAVPEPGTYVLMAGGLALLAAFARRRRT